MANMVLQVMYCCIIVPIITWTFDVYFICQGLLCWSLHSFYFVAHVQDISPKYVFENYNYVIQEPVSQS